MKAGIDCAFISNGSDMIRVAFFGVDNGSAYSPCDIILIMDETWINRANRTNDNTFDTDFILKETIQDIINLINFFIF